MDEQQTTPTASPAAAQMPSPTPPESPRREPMERKIHIGPIIGSIIIIVLLVLGGLYFLGKKVSEEGTFAPEPNAILESLDSAREALETQGTSDAVQAIEEDLNATDLKNLDAEFQNIETELNF